MSVNQIIEKALTGVVKHIWPMSCPKEVKPDEYIVYNPELEEPGVYADDEDLEWIQHMQIHLFTKGNYVKMRKDIRKKLRDAGFTITGIYTTYEKDSKYNHLCFECSIEEEE